jgi:hypothetical protein
MSRRTPAQRIHGLAQKVKNRDRGFGHQLLTTEFFGHKLLTCSPNHSRVIDCTCDCAISPKKQGEGVSGPRSGDVRSPWRVILSRAAARIPAAGVRVVYLIGFSLVSGCVTYNQTTFLRPSGPGRTISAAGVPRIREVRVGSATTLHLSAEAKSGGYQLILVFAINYQHALRLTRAAVDFRCGADSIQAVELPAAQEGRLKDGVGYIASKGAGLELGGRGYQRNSPQRGDVSVGEYTFEVDLPGCSQPTFSIQLPQLQIDGAAADVGPVVFTPETRRILFSPPIA